ncbi:MAG TPA: efflux RND transporter periplasmic adaptor subunit [Tepidisphaeraceae bacterium]|nr:efflux RND transporter periplasmic adaptor subunit [Tepidisphaeraceae bacterium]
MGSIATKIGIFIVCLAILGGAGGWYWFHSGGPDVNFRTDAVTRGNLMPTIMASGTVEPQEVIDVGAQIEGMILTFGTDDAGKTVDYGSHVNVGTVLANIDSRTYASAAASAAATLRQAQAGVTKAIADLNENNAKLDQAAADWRRAQKLGPSDALSQSDYDTYKANYEVAVATVGDSQAAVDQAKATVGQAQAAYDQANQNLQYCTIKSPVNGVIIDRRVTIGETVVSSLDAPSLFLIAEDLTQIQVWVSVNEADIGNIYPGEQVTFSVDAHPTRTFHGTVGKIRLNATMTQNVVTYTVEVNTDNTDGKLLPYMTANVTFEVKHLKDVMLVPNAALRWYPQPDMVAPDVRAALEAAKHTGGANGASAESDSASAAQPSSAAGPATTSAHAHHHSAAGTDAEGETITTRGTVWVLDGKYVRPVRVRLGDSDGINTVVLSSQGDALKEGDHVVEGIIVAREAAAETTNPFAPHFAHGGHH